jgi:hypothetical protein
VDSRSSAQLALVEAAQNGDVFRRGIRTPFSG